MEDEHKPIDLPGVDEGKATDESVIRTHAMIRRTPVAGSPVAFFTSVALIIVFVFAWFYVRRYSAEWDSKGTLSEREHIAAMKTTPPPPPKEIVYDGAKLYTAQCSACHQPTGQGVAGAFPPLAGSEWVTGNSAVPIKIVLKGISGPITVAGSEYNGMMPGLGGLKDAQIAAIVTYVRSSWGNESSEVTAEEVAAIRAEVADHGPWTAGDLQGEL